VLKKGFTILILRGIGVVSSYLLLAIIGTRYGAESLGIYAFTTNAVNLAALVAALGIDQFILRTAPDALQSTGFWALTARRTLPAVAAAAGVLFLVSRASESPSTSNALAVAALFVPLVVAHTMVVEALAATGQRTVSELIRSVVRPLAVVAGLWLLASTSIYAPLWWAAAITFPLVIWGFSLLVTSNQKQETDALHGHLSFAVLTVGGFLLANAASLILEYREGTEAVGTFNLAVRLAHLSAFGLVVSQAVFGPAIAQASQSNQPNEARRHALKASAFSASVALAAAAVLWLGRSTVQSIFGVGLDDATLAPILLGQVAYATSAGAFLALSMGHRSRQAAAALATVTGFQLLVLALTDTNPAVVHGLSFALLALSYIALASRRIPTFAP
jgi:O-antigen/teichoic acid export membrane protein